MLFLEFAESASEIEMRGIVHLLVFEQQKRIPIYGETDLFKILITKRLRSIDTRDSGAELGMNGFNFHTALRVMTKNRVWNQVRASQASSSEK